MVIYYIKGEEKKDSLLEVLEDYIRNHMSEREAEEILKDGIKIARHEKGKPYIKDHPEIKFSVSHAMDRWVCAVSDCEVGIDSELKTRDMKRYEDVSKRYFCCSEAMMVEDRGRSAFLRIWTRKEAYLKYTGQGLGAGLSSINVVKDEVITDDIPSVGCTFREIDVDGDMLTVICTDAEDTDKGTLIKYRTAPGSFEGMPEGIAGEGAGNEFSKWSFKKP